MGYIGVVHDAMQNESSKIWIRQKSCSNFSVLFFAFLKYFTTMTVISISTFIVGEDIDANAQRTITWSISNN